MSHSAVKTKKLDFPTELIFEIITFVPFRYKWENIRISKLVDIIVVKLRKKYIINLKISRKILKNEIEVTTGNINLCLKKLAFFVKDGSRAEECMQISCQFGGIFYQIKTFSSKHACFAKIDEEFKNEDWPAQPIVNHFTDRDNWKKAGKERHQMIKNMVKFLDDKHATLDNLFYTPFLKEYKNFLDLLLSAFKGYVEVAEKSYKDFNERMYDEQIE
ncbi:unnamed protein product [Meloidogyne enterolobii]|uniref:Uncharacterized protein n=1 Tax=Meloidogyne enterolobii TaxID=390850 RepID=A0ACB1B3P9_MELEN